MRESYLDEQGHLIPEQAWHSFVDSLLVDGFVQGEDAEPVPIPPKRRRELLQELHELLVDAVKRRLPGDETVKVGLLFSGGIDSTLIGFCLRRQGIPFTCITVGFQDGDTKEPEDVTQSRRIARELGFEQETILFDLAQADALFKETANILGDELADVVNVGVGAVEVSGIERAKDLNITHLFGGLGAEELFAGYDRHEQAFKTGGHQGLAEERVAGLHRMHARDLRRDTAIAHSLGITLATPFLDEALTRFALGLRPELLIDENETFSGRRRGDVPEQRLVKKLVLREAAEAMGLPHAIAFRPKRAAQYGARTNNALTRLTRLKGFRHKEEYLASLTLR